MKFTAFATTLFVTLTAFIGADNANADITVDDSGTDLVINFSPDAAEQVYAQYYGLNVEIYDYGGRVLVRSLNEEITVNGGTYEICDYPADDIIVNLPLMSNWYAMHTLFIHDITMQGNSDDLRLTVGGTINIDTVYAYNHSHSSIFLSTGIVEMTNCYAVDDIDIKSADTTMLNSAVGDNLWLEGKTRYSNASVLLENVYIADNLNISLGNRSDTVTFRNYVQVGESTDILLGSGNDAIHVDIADQYLPYSTLGDAYADGGNGSDTIYQNVEFFFRNLNAKRFESFKD